MKSSHNSQPEITTTTTAVVRSLSQSAPCMPVASTQLFKTSEGNYAPTERETTLLGEIVRQPNSVENESEKGTREAQNREALLAAQDRLNTLRQLGLAGLSPELRSIPQEQRAAVTDLRRSGFGKR